MNNETPNTGSSTSENKPSSFPDFIKLFTNEWIKAEWEEDTWGKFVNDFFKWETKWFLPRLYNLFKWIIWDTKKDTSSLKDEIANGIISPLDSQKLAELENEWKDWYKKIAKALANAKWVPEDIFINLINKENWTWNPKIKNQISDAYWLWQMIPDTWDRFWVWLIEDSTPTDQLLASIKYLKYIKEHKKCTWEQATAYYNTWEWYDKDSNDFVKDSYIEGNLKAIVWLIPWCKWKTAEELYRKVTKKQYFIAASAYYSWKDYSNIA